MGITDRLKNDGEGWPKDRPAVPPRPARPWVKGLRLLNRFEILGVKQGGMGVVYLVHDHEWGRKFAIKTVQDRLLPDAAALSRFMAEAETWAKLERHTNIVFAEFVEKIEGRPLLFLECLEAGDLGRFIGNLTVLDALDFGIQFCCGMEYAYRKLGVIHRDIKPGNVMVQEDPRFRSGYCFKVTDFGLVRAYGAGSGEDASEVSTGVGTVLYMPPEQFSSPVRERFLPEGKVTTRSDIYSFGVTLFQILTGKLPFYDVNGIFTAPAPRPQMINPAIPDPLDALIVRCLEKDPGRRFSDFTCLREELTGIIDSLVPGRYTVIGTPEELTGTDRLNRGVALGNLGKYAQALEWIESALKMDASDPRAWNDRGNTLTCLNRVPEAIESFDNALALFPGYASAMCRKGIALSRTGNYPEALRWYDKALGINPEYPEALNHKGVALGCLRRFPESLACFDAALRISPYDPSVLRNKGGVLGAMGRYREAGECFDKALGLSPDDAKILMDKAMTLVSLGRPKEALICFDRAVAASPGEYMAWYGRGIALASCRRNEEAIRSLEKHIELFPPELIRSGLTSTVQQAGRIIRELKGA